MTTPIKDMLAAMTEANAGFKTQINTFEKKHDITVKSLEYTAAKIESQLLAAGVTPAAPAPTEAPKTKI